MATPYRDAVTADAPAVWWHLSETTGTTFADSVAGLNATITGSVTLNQTGLAKNDTTVAATFSTASLQYAQAATSATFRPTTMSVEALIRSRTSTGNNRIVELGADSSWALYLETGQIKFTVFGKASAVWTWPGDSGRHHVVGTYNGTGLAILYVDGVEVGREQGGGTGAPSTTTDPLRIAGKPTSTAAGDGWEGTLQEVAIYSQALTATKVAAHAAAAGLSSSVLSFAGYTWEVAERGTASPYANTFSADQAWTDGAGLHLRVDPLGGGYSAGAEIALSAGSLGYGTYTCVVSGNVSTMHPNVVWGGMFTYGNDGAYGHRELDANEQSKWSGTTATLSHTVWMPSSTSNMYAARGGYNAANNMTTQTAASHTAVMIWTPSAVTFRLYTGTTVNPVNLFRESIVTAGASVTFSKEDGSGSYTGPAIIPAPNDERIHFNLWVCPNYSGGSDPATVTAQELVVSSFGFVAYSGGPASPFSVAVDWARDGTWTSTGDDVTDRVRGGLSASYGRDQATALSPVVAGRGAFTLDNTSRDYSPRNAASPLFGLVKPSRPVLMQRTVGGAVYTIFRGHTDDSPIDPDVDSKTVGFSLIDYLADFRGVNVTTTLYQGIRIGAAIDAVLTAAGWPGGRVLDTGATILPWWWCDGADASDMLQQLLAAEGPPSLVTIDENGSFVFRDRHHRVTSAASTASQATLTGSGTTEPIMGKGFRYSEPWSNIINDAQITVDERQPQGFLSAVWTSDQTISIGASASYVVVVSASDPFLRAVAPVGGVDYNLDSGAIVTATLSRTSGQSTSITLTAAGAGAQITGLQLRAVSVPVVRSRIVTAADATSQTAYGVRSLPSDLEPKWGSYPDVVDIAALLVAQRKDPLTQITAVFTCQDSQTARLTAVLARDLSDRVTVVEDETVLNAPFYIESIQHDAAAATEHVVTFGLEAVPAAGATAVFTLGTSTLNSATPLAY